MDSDMKIRCRRDKFEPLFTLISSFTSTRDVRPALQNVKMLADEKSVILTATDGGIGAKGELPAEDGFVVERAGEAILPAKLLRKILAETKDDEIELEVVGQVPLVLQVESQLSSTELGSPARVACHFHVSLVEIVGGYLRAIG